MRNLIASVSGLALLTLVGCGGGGEADPAVAATFRTHTVVLDRGVASAGTYVNATAEFETFGPTIAGVTWRGTHVGAGAGDLVFSDASCKGALKNVRDVAGSEKKAAFWRCTTTVLAEDGTDGQFVVTATAVDSDGNSTAAEAGLTIN